MRTRFVSLASIIRLAGSVCLVLAAPAVAHAFALFPEFGGATVRQTLEAATRWSSITGLDDGLQVGVEEGITFA